MTNRSRVKDPHFLAKKQQKMAIFEKTEYWGLKDPLEVRVQHRTCIYMGDNFSSHFEPKKFNRVAGGAKTAKMGVFWYLQKYPILAVFGPSCRPG